MDGHSRRTAPTERRSVPGRHVAGLAALAPAGAQPGAERSDAAAEQPPENTLQRADVHEGRAGTTVKDNPASIAAAERRRRTDGALALENRIALRVDEVARVLGIAPRTVRELLPRLPHFREDRVILIPVDGLRRWVEQRVREDAAEARAIGDGLATKIRETLFK